VEATWLQEGVELRVSGTAGCSGLQRLEVTLVPRADPPAYAEATLRPVARPNARGTAICLTQRLDTTVMVLRPEQTRVVRVWAPYPFDPGLRLFASTADSLSGRGAGGEVLVDTLSGGCPVIAVLHPGDAARQYAIDLTSPVFPGFEPQPGSYAFVTGRIGSVVSSCGGLPPFRLEGVQVGIGF